MNSPGMRAAATDSGAGVVPLKRGWWRMVVTLTVVGLMGAFGAGTALADAPNPIGGTTHGEIVTNPDGTVTVFVRGEWNWLSHKSDCNEDRAGAGVGLVWNDPTEVGYVVSKGGISAGVGVSTLRPGDTANLIDGMVHPADLGNVPQGFTNPGQQFFDPVPQAAGQSHPHTQWKGGCGREPLNGAGAGQFVGHPWGSWGYDKSSAGSDGRIHVGYVHTYAKRSDVTSVCVNFYDVHGGDKVGGAKFQLPNGSKEIDVLGNGDNSIQTNSFLVNGGSCFSTFEEPNFTIHKEQRIAGEPSYTTSELKTEVGKKVEYKITVTNTGNTTMKFGPLSDSKCSNIQPAGETSLKPAESESFTCEHVLTEGGTYVNVATIAGNEKPKESNPVAANAGKQGVKAVCTVSQTGTILKGVSGSKRHPFTVHISSVGIKQITFFVDGRKVKTLKSSQASKGQFSVRINPRRFGFGAHTVSVKATSADPACANIARSGVFVRPRPPAIKPNFTG